MIRATAVRGDARSLRAREQSVNKSRAKNEPIPKVGSNPAYLCAFWGAGDGTRTHDNLLGKQALYQLSYTRTVLTLV